MQALWNRDRLKYNSQQEFEAAVEEGVQEQYSKIVNPEVSRHELWVGGSASKQGRPIAKQSAEKEER
jgi:hypothetical protein